MAKSKKEEVRDSSFPLAASPKPNTNPTPEQKESARIYKAKQDIDARTKEIFKDRSNSEDARFYRREELRKANVPKSRWN